MPVVINEFEVVTEPAPAHAPAAQGAEGEAQRPAERERLDPMRLLAEERFRQERVRAT